MLIVLLFDLWCYLTSIDWFGDFDLDPEPWFIPAHPEADIGAVIIDPGAVIPVVDPLAWRLVWRRRRHL